MAPELYQKKAYDHKVDVFAFGTLLWEIFAREVPFEGLEPTDIMQKVMKEEPLPNRKSIPANIFKLVQNCRQLDPAKRPEFEQIY